MLHYIDFHQLQIENKQYVAKIEERNDELLSVKLLTGKTIQVLNDYKKRLNEKLEEEAWLKGEVAAKRALLQKLDKEETRIEKEVRGEKREKPPKAADRRSAGYAQYPRLYHAEKGDV